MLSEKMRVELFSHLRDAKSNIQGPNQRKEENAIELLESISSDYIRSPNKPSLAVAFCP